MNLITPDAGLLFWMVVIFGLLFLLLWKYAFPLITSMVDKRSGRIEQSLKDAKEIEARMAEMTEEHARLLEEAKKEQARILSEATESRRQILDQARTEAREEAQKIVADARVQIASEKENALRDIRREVAVLSVEVAEKILRQQLSGDAAQADYIGRLVDEVASRKNS